jgi:hypothetical protein
VRTAYRDSVQFYGGDKWTNPKHGVGQGNGVGPAIWAVLSTPILNFVQSKGFGCELIPPISQRYTKFVGYAFIIDTDLIQKKNFGDNYIETITKLQGSFDTWDASLKLTGGALVPENIWY